jgi:uridylate kinase
MENFDQADLAFSKNKIGVGGGMLEGLTTDAVSALFAEKIKADFVVNLGDTDGIFTADPKKDKSAKRLAKMSHEELVKLAVEKDLRKAGTHFVFDLVASKLAARSNIELKFVNGKKLVEVEKALSGKPFAGTTVSG